MLSNRGIYFYSWSATSSWHWNKEKGQVPQLVISQAVLKSGMAGTSSDSQREQRGWTTVNSGRFLQRFLRHRYVWLRPHLCMCPASLTSFWDFGQNLPFLPAKSCVWTENCSLSQVLVALPIKISVWLQTVRNHCVQCPSRNCGQEQQDFHFTLRRSYCISKRLYSMLLKTRSADIGLAI